VEHFTLSHSVPGAAHVGLVGPEVREPVLRLQPSRPRKGSQDSRNQVLLPAGNHRPMYIWAVSTFVCGRIFNTLIVHRGGSGLNFSGSGSSLRAFPAFKI
jgi:hypothetical protein